MHNEDYEYVFNNLYTYLNSIKNNNNNMIVITGDILHNKVSLSPLSIVLCYYFLITLSKIMKVVFIAGNHNINIKNVEKFDLITNFIKQYYNHIILISHIASFNDYIACFIELKSKKDNTTKICINYISINYIIILFYKKI